MSLIHSIAHFLAYHKSEKPIKKVPKMSDDPIEVHLQFDYLFAHGNKKPLRLYKKGKKMEAIKENIKSLKKFTKELE